MPPAPPLARPPRPAPPGRRRARRWALLGLLLGGLAGLLSQAPARWLAAGVARLSGGHLLLQGAEGTVWQGSALTVLSGGPGSRDARSLPDRLHWRLGLGPGGLQLHLRQACCLDAGSHLRLQPGWGGLRLGLRPGPASGPVAAGEPPLIGRWPAAWLAGLGTPWNTLQPGGRLLLHSAGLDFDTATGQLSGQLSLTVAELSARLSPLPRLGSYRLTLAAEAPGEPPQLRLSTLAGPLQLDGQGSLGPRGLRFRGEARAEPGDEAALANLLNIIGRRQGARSVLAIG